jgi:hypothetical protein
MSNKYKYLLTGSPISIANRVDLVKGRKPIPFLSSPLLQRQHLFNHHTPFSHTNPILQHGRATTQASGAQSPSLLGMTLLVSDGYFYDQNISPSTFPLLCGVGLPHFCPDQGISQ